LKPIKVAQIGTGHDHAVFTFGSMLKLRDCFEVVGIAECNPERMEALDRPPYRDAKRLTVEELLAMEDLEAVAVETDEELATDIAQKFADKGVAIHLDKPGSAVLSTFRKLIDTVRAQNSPFQMGYMYRFNPLVKRSLEMVRQGRLGKIYSVEAHMSLRHSVEKRRWLEKYPGGMTYFLGCHLVDLILQIQGMPEKVIPLNAVTGIGGAMSEDLGFVAFQYPNGVSFLKSCAHEYNGFNRRQLVICGSEGTIEIQPLEIHYPIGTFPGPRTEHHASGKVTLKETETDPWLDTAEIWDSGCFDRYDGMMRAFAQIIRGEAANPYSLDYELALFETVMKCCNVKEEWEE
jgi:predicted dehydrogenase